MMRNSDSGDEVSGVGKPHKQATEGRQSGRKRTSGHSFSEHGMASVLYHHG